MIFDDDTPERRRVQTSVGRSRSRRDQRDPADLMRSRRVGLSVTVCARCGAKTKQGLIEHARGCPAKGEKMRLVTGPLASHETSKDSGWRLAR